MAKKVAPYMVFVHSYMRQHNIRNRDEAMRLCNDIWVNMDEEAKKPYREESKSQNKTTRLPITPAPASNTPSLPSDDFMSNFNASLYDEYFSDCRTPEQIVEKVFYVLVFNVLVRTREAEYIPNEIGLVKYSIKRGVIASMHYFIEASDVPLGCALGAKEMEEVHGIPQSGFARSIGYRQPNDATPKDQVRSAAMRDLLTKIVEFSEEGQVPQTVELVSPKIFFARSDQIAQTKGCLDFMAKVAEMNYYKTELQVLDLGELYYTLCSRSGTARFKQRCLDELSGSKFDYTTLADCDFHLELDNIHCAIGVAKRLTYLMSSVLCPAYQIEPTSDHIPIASTEQVYAIGGGGTGPSGASAEEQNIWCSPPAPAKREFEDSNSNGPKRGIGRGCPRL